MTDIYIVRHGNTFDKGDIVTRVGARTDLPLSSSGEAQADRLATHFRDIAPNGFTAAYCSELQRTRQTAETILQAYD
ncbi:MAG: histidine phosphatase family protein, partial [Pseudomonadota bacterium]